MIRAISSRRYVIDFEDLPLRRDPNLAAWSGASASDQKSWLCQGIVPQDFGEPVAADWPDLLHIVEQRVKPERLKSDNKSVRVSAWWKHWRPRPDLKSDHLWPW